MILQVFAESEKVFWQESAAQADMTKAEATNFDRRTRFSALGTDNRLPAAAGFSPRRGLSQALFYQCSSKPITSRESLIIRCQAAA
jgi:hypothetical protein